MSGELAPVTLEADDAVELAQLLEFVHDRIDYVPDPLGQWLARFTGWGYELAELRADLARFGYGGQR